MKTGSSPLGGGHSCPPFLLVPWLHRSSADGERCLESRRSYPYIPAPIGEFLAPTLGPVPSSCPWRTVPIETGNPVCDKEQGRPEDIFGLGVCAVEMIVARKWGIEAGFSRF